MGTRFEKNKKYGPMTLTQPWIIEIIIELVGLNSTYRNFKMHDTLSYNNMLLENDPYGKPRVKKWNYKAVVSFPSYCNSMVRPDIAMAT